MYKIGKITMYCAEDLCEALHVSKETAYKILSMPQAKIAGLGRKKLITEENLFELLSSKIDI